MRFLRSLRGSPSGTGEPGSTADVEDRSGADAVDDDEARAAELMEEFDAELSDLARRQVRFAGHAWSPPRQMDRRGRWVLGEAIEGTAPDGKSVRLRAGDVLELAEGGEDDPGRASWRFFRVKDGRVVDLPAGAGGAWPGELARPRGSGA